MSSNIDIKIKASTQGTEEVKKLETQLSALGKIDAFRKLKKDLEASRSAWKAAQAEVARLAREMAASEKPTKELSSRFNAAKKEAAGLKTQFLQNQQSLHKLRGSLSQAGVDTKNLNAEQKKLALGLARSRAEMSQASKINAAMGMLNVRPLKDIQGEIKATEAAYTRLKQSGKLSMTELYNAKLNMKTAIAELRSETNGWATAISRAQVGMAALAGIGYAAVRSFSGYSGFAQRMAEVNTLLDVSEDRFKSLSDEIVDLSTRIPQTASELAAAEYDIISAGVALEDSARVLELSAKAAVAGVTDTKTAVKAGVGVINAYGKDIGELGSVYDILFQTVKSGVTTFPELAQHIGEVLPTARAADVQFHEVAAAIASLTKAGIRTPQAATAIKGAINAMAAPTPEAKKKFDELGITWQGLIPTLEAIREKGLSVDQMRFLIPDVEARTGVLSLTQNMEDFNQNIEKMVVALGAMIESFDKMKDTPETQIKLFKNEIAKTTKTIGEMVSEALLPGAQAVRLLIDSIEQADPVTQNLIGVMATAGAGFVLWKIGLGHIVLGLQGMAVQAAVASKDLLTVANSATLAGHALKIGFAAGAAYGAYQIGKFIKVAYDTVKAVQSAKAAQEDLFKTTDRVMKQYDDFKDIRLPENITGSAPEELEALRRELQGAKAYWVALQQSLMSRAEETTFLGVATKDALDAQKELKTVNQRLKEINGDLARLKDAGIAAGDGMKAPAEAVKATADQLEEFEKQARKAYDHARDQARKYAQEVIDWEEKIKYARMSTADQIRELERKGLSEEQQWNDEKLQAEEKLAAARQALRENDFELAEKLAKEAQGLYAGLAEEVKGIDEAGTEVVVKTIDDTKQVAVAGVREVGAFVEQLYQTQKDSAEQTGKQWAETAAQIEEKLAWVARARETQVAIELSNLAEAQAAINNLTKDETKHITVVVTERVQREEARAAGGRVGMNRGGRLPGFGGGDRIRALLEAGEFVIRKEAVKKYGSALFDALNAMRLPKMPTLPRVPGPLKFAQGGMVPAGGGEVMTIRFQAGGVELPLQVMGRRGTTRQQIREFDAELKKMGLARG